MPKCRCGIKVISRDGTIVNDVDGKPHKCFTSEKEIMLKSDNPSKEESKISRYTKQEDDILNEMEMVLIERDSSLKINVAKLGMKLKIIYQSMPNELREK